MAATATLSGAALSPGGSAWAFEFDTGNPELSVRWDNTPRVNLGWRVEQRDEMIGNNQLYDEGTYSFDRGDMVAARLDWFTELDVVWQKRFGGRVSAQLWYDGAYGTYGRSNPRFAPIASYVDNRYSDYTRDLYRGPDAEFLDAFVFGRFDLGDVPLTVKLGRHTLYWGESLFVNGNLNGIAYAQNPLDLQKGFATPGAEAKELFRPLTQISAQAALSDEFSVMAQYYFEWDSFRFPEGGTYLGPVDFAFRGPQRQFLGAPLGFAANGGNINPDERGDWGVGARWSPDWLDGTLGFYYRNYSDKLPQVLLTRRCSWWCRSPSPPARCSRCRCRGSRCAGTRISSPPAAGSLPRATASWSGCMPRGSPPSSARWRPSDCSWARAKARGDGAGAARHRACRWRSSRCPWWCPRSSPASPSTSHSPWPGSPAPSPG